MPGEHRDLKRWLDERFEHHENWMVATAIGLHPVEYRDLRRVLGHVSHYANGRIEVRRDGQPDAATAEAAVYKVADAIFRLVSVGAIRVREPWESLHEEARPGNSQAAASPPQT